MARQGTPSGTPSVNSFKSGSKISGTTPRATSAVSSTMGYTRPRDDLVTPEIIDLDDEGGKYDSRDLNKTNDKFDKLRRAKIC